MMKMSTGRLMILVTSISVLLICIPLLFIVFNTSFLQPVNSKDFPVTILLKGSVSILITQISGLTSLLSVAIDILMDIGAQNETMSLAVRLKERIAIFFGLAFFGVMYLSCRSLDCIAHIYVASNNLKTISMVAAVYSAIYPELCNKKDPFLMYGLTSAFLTWIAANVANAYSMYYNVTILPIVFSALQCIFYVVAVLATCRWIQIVGTNVGRFHFNNLTVEEYTFLQYLVPTLVYAPSVSIWNVVTGDMNWQTRSVETLIFYISANCLAAAVIIVVPGRTARMLANLHMNMLALKQIFVRYVSHEIRSPLNIVHAGLDIVRHEFELKDGSSVVQISTDTAKMIENIFSASESAIANVNDLLHYEHLDSGTFKLELCWQPVGQLMGKNLEWAKLLAAQKNIHVIIDDTATTIVNTASSIHSRQQVVELDSVEGDIEQGGGLESEEDQVAPPQVSYLHVDICRVDQVIRNLITNAIKFTQSNGSICIKCSCELTDKRTISKVGADAIGTFRLDVVDSGVGIDHENQKKVFGEFNQFNRNAQQAGGGSGLGLWICKRIIQMHKGKIGFSSAGLGQGSTFFFELPLYSAASAGVDLDRTMLTLISSPVLERRAAPAAVRGSEDGGTAVLEQDCVLSDFAASEHDEEGVQASMRHSTKSEPLQRQRDFSSLSPIRISSSFSEAALSPNNTSSGSRGGATPMMRAAGLDHSETVLFSLEESSSSIGVNDPMRFLIVDDSAMNLKLMSKIIISGEKLGRLAVAEILEADDGDSACQMLGAEMRGGRRVDFVLMDSVMVLVRMHGPEATVKMRQELHYAGPIIGVTGNALPEDISRFLTHGANEVLIKPLSRAKLLEALYRHMHP